MEIGEKSLLNTKQRNLNPNNSWLNVLVSKLKGGNSHCPDTYIVSFPAKSKTKLISLQMKSPLQFNLV